MKTSEIYVSPAEAEAPLLKLCLQNGIPHEEPDDITKNAIFIGGDIYFCPDGGWIYLRLPIDDNSWGSEGFVSAQVWSGISKIHSQDCPIDYTLQMSFPEGMIHDSQMQIGVYNRKLVTHPKNFYSDHDSSLDAYDLFSKGMRWVLDAGLKLVNRQARDI